MIEHIDMYYLCYDKHWDYRDPMISSSMQDMNWKTIYENDFVKWEDGDISLVEFDWNKFHIQWYTMSEMNYEKCVIIWNIYENPEIITNCIKNSN